MNSRWSADSSTNDTTADSPVVARGQRRQTRVVEAHRDLAGEVLEQVPGQARARGRRRGPRPSARACAEQLVVAGEVGVEVAQRGRELGEGDAERSRAESSRSTRRRRRGPRRRRHGRRTARSAATRRGGSGAAAAGRGRPPRRRPAPVVGPAVRPRPVAWTCSARPVHLLGEVAGDLVAASRAPAARGSSVAQRLRVAEPLAQPAARVEAAARRRVDRRGHVALEDDPAPAAPRRPGPGPGPPTAARPCTDGAASCSAPATGASSTIRPRYITAIRSLMWRTTDRSWAMNR